MCDGHSQEIERLGSIPIRMFDGVTRVLANVRYVPNFKRNLISESILTDKGFKIVTEGNYKIISKGAVEVMRAKKVHGLYVLEGKAEVNVSNVNTVSQNANLWHNKLGHISNVYLEKLKSAGVIDNIEIDKDAFCEVCLEGKHHRTPFRRSNSRAEKPFNYVHADLWGPSPVNTLGGNRYFISIVDDFSRKTWVYLLKHKSEAFEKFTIWHTFYENQWIGN